MRINGLFIPLKLQSIKMPALSRGKILVTGANGFVAMVVIDSLIKHGYSIRAAVRSESKGAYIKQYFGNFDAQVEITVIPDYLEVC